MSKKVIETHDLERYIVNDAMLCEINMCMYGLPQAGLISQRRLIALLDKHGYLQDPNVPCLFKHRENGCVFTLVVDDFGVKCPNREVAQHLIASLEELYTITVNSKGDKYLGFNIDWDYLAGTVTLSMRDYIGKLLERFSRGQDIRGAKSPARYNMPVYGSKSPQMVTVDDTPALGKEDRL